MPDKEDTYCRVKTKDGLQFITMPDGTIIPGQIYTRVSQNITDRPEAIIKLKVVFDETTDEVSYRNYHK